MLLLTLVSLVFSVPLDKNCPASCDATIEYSTLQYRLQKWESALIEDCPGKNTNIGFCNYIIGKKSDCLETDTVNQLNKKIKHWENHRDKVDYELGELSIMRCQSFLPTY